MRCLVLVVALMLALVAPASSSSRSSTSPQQLWRAFECIHRHEGAWSSDSANGYYGGLQMDSTFERMYGSEFLAMWGHANRWPAAVQITVAMRAYASRGFSPWPNTSKLCGLR